MESAEVYAEHAEAELYNSASIIESAEFYNARAIAWAILAVAAATTEARS